MHFYSCSLSSSDNLQALQEQCTAITENAEYQRDQVLQKLHERMSDVQSLHDSVIKLLQDNPIAGPSHIDEYQAKS